jgi:hypothetical protein
MDAELLKWLSPLGVGGVLAAFIFFFYRRDFLRERQNGVANLTLMRSLVENNTAAITKLVSGVEVLSRSLTDTQERTMSHFADLVRAVQQPK